MSLAVEWTKNLKTQDEKDKFTSLVVNNRILLGRLLEIIDDKIDSLERAECSQETYQNPAYASWQAHVNGKRASLKDIRRLLEFLES